MKEQKKRFRPTLTAYRELEAKADKQAEFIKFLEKNLKDLREDYKELKECSVGKNVVGDLDRLNKSLSDENNSLKDRNERLRDEIKWLMKRSLWKRIINTPYTPPERFLRR